MVKVYTANMLYAVCMQNLSSFASGFIESDLNLCEKEEKDQHDLGWIEKVEL